MDLKIGSGEKSDLFYPFSCQQILMKGILHLLYADKSML